MKPEYQKIIDEALERIKAEEDEVENFIFKAICWISTIIIFIALYILFQS